MAPFHTWGRNECSFFMNMVFSIATETIGVLTLFPLLYGKWYEARMRNFMLPENALSAQFQVSLLPLSAPSLFSWLVPFLSSILRIHIQSSALCVFLSISYSLIHSPTYHFHSSTRITSLRIPNPDLLPWSQSHISNCSTLEFHSCLKFNSQDRCPLFLDKLPFLLTIPIAISQSSFSLGSLIRLEPLKSPLPPFLYLITKFGYLFLCKPSGILCDIPLTLFHALITWGFMSSPDWSLWHY